jgi:signal transduction histidine kinase
MNMKKQSRSYSAPVESPPVREIENEQVRSMGGQVGLLKDYLSGKILFTRLKFRHKNLLRQTRPLAEHLEKDIFPNLRENGQNWISLQVDNSGASPRLFSTGETGNIELPGTHLLAQNLYKRGIREIRLHAFLEMGQILEALLVLFHAHKYLDRTPASDLPVKGWSAARIAAALKGKSGFHRFCSLMWFDPESRAFIVEYTYCELFFSRALRDYARFRSPYQDHRALFHIAPRAAILAFLLLLLPAELIFWNFWAGFAVWVFVALAVAGWIGTAVYTIGSIIYDREHRDLLIQEYLKQIDTLARFPENNPNPTLKFDRLGEILYINPAARRLVVALTGDENQVESILPENYRELIRKTLDEQKIMDAETEAGHKVLRYQVSAFSDDRSVIFAGSDITQLRQTEKDLRKANEELQELGEMKDEFMRIASHDLKNPLSSVLSANSLVVDMLQPGTEITPSMHDLMKRSLNGARQMKNIIEDFLDFRVIEDGEFQLRKQPVNLNRLVHDVLDSNQDYAEKKHIRTRLELAEDLPEIAADFSRISQVVQNLLSNAIKFSHEETVVCARTIRNGSTVTLEVQDQGPGLSDEDLSNVFGKYKRLSNRPTGGEKSSGLGLYISKQLVQLHGGQIGVRNNPDRGASFWVQLPVQPGEKS